MKAIEKEFTEKKIVGYEAFDGTYFKKEEECEEYEKSAKGVTKSRVHALVINEDSEGIIESDELMDFFAEAAAKEGEDEDLVKEWLVGEDLVSEDWEYLFDRYLESKEEDE